MTENVRVAWGGSEWVGDCDGVEYFGKLQSYASQIRQIYKKNANKNDWVQRAQKYPDFPP